MWLVFGSISFHKCMHSVLLDCFVLVWTDAQFIRRLGHMRPVNCYYVEKWDWKQELLALNYVNEDIQSEISFKEIQNETVHV